MKPLFCQVVVEVKVISTNGVATITNTHRGMAGGEVGSQEDLDGLTIQAALSFPDGMNFDDIRQLGLPKSKPKQ